MTNVLLSVQMDFPAPVLKHGDGDNPEERQMRTPLARVRGLGSAKSGTDAFIAERVTSIALALLTPYVAIILILLAGQPHEAVVSWLGSIYVAPAVAAFAVISIVHMRLGMNVVIEDYVHGHGLKTLLLVANWMFCWMLLALCIFAILKLMFVQA
ncbi:succinate dehydrogenase, hydrophobic membrane anchor protein [Chelativorans sp.]|uniref:succinate dehydrogenase, hydrophobic membrane anchor protein n=1 Tax=Chelativorans sp. TaxID=2203393 RepID=UPI002812822C|nr:succinate dehydrogenase, hydrophobic membrane anchor protein [Chelativorans sp.]